MPYEKIVTVPANASSGQIPVADGSGGFSWGDQSDGSDASLGIIGASVGQIAKVTAVDANGKPTAWEPVDMLSGGGVEKTTLANFTLEEDFTADAALKVPLLANPFKFSQLLISITAQLANDSGQYYGFLHGADGQVAQICHLNTKFSKNEVKNWFVAASIFKTYVSAVASENTNSYMWSNSAQYSWVYVRRSEASAENCLRLNNISAKAGMTVVVEGI